MNLLPQIHTQLERVSRRSRGLTLLLTVIIMFGVVTAVYAVVNGQIGLDPGMEGVDAANLVTDLNLSQTVDGVTLTLEWAYIDAHRVVMGYNIVAPEGSPAGLSYSTDVHIYDEANSFIGEGGGGGGGGGMGRTSQYQFSYGIDFPNGLPDELTMHVDIDATPNDPLPPGASGGGYGSGSGGGGGISGGEGDAALDPLPEFTPEPGVRMSMGMMPTESTVGTFAFTFTLPTYPAIELTPDQSVESNGLEVTLDRLSVAPSMTIAHLCYDLPDGRDWTPALRLQVDDGAMLTANGWGVDTLPMPEDTRRCSSYSFYAPYIYAESTFTLSFTRLSTSASYTPERAEQFKEMLAAQGVEVNILEATGEGFNYEITSQPDGDVGALIQAAMDEAFQDHFEGEWVYTVPIPALER